MHGNFLEAINISKAFDGVQALDRVDLTIKTGETHCLVGENGSGKSTLIKIIGGVLHPDAGQIIINDKTFGRLHAIDSIREGVQIIYQDLSLFPNLTVAENISLNQMVESNHRTINWASIKKIARHALGEIEEECNLSERVENLSMSKRQIVAISRALTQNAKLIIMDEPTSAITREEVDHLFRVITKLKEKGIATLFVSHKLSEVFEISENVTILRDGKKIGDYPTSELDNEKLIYLMTGRSIKYSPYIYTEKLKQPELLLEVRNLTKSGQFENISFSLRKGEILGITGLLGSGRTEMALSLFGLNKPDSGEIIIDGKKVEINSTQEALKLGLSYLPEDRLNQGLFEE
ncbi:MAG: sugar ABC transporter ATP-binding protein, partial [Spirochaetota bacterium]